MKISGNDSELYKSVYKEKEKVQNETPLSNIIRDGGMMNIFRTIGCIGDSLSSGEFEYDIEGEKGYWDCYDYSWGKQIEHITGISVTNYSHGGLTAYHLYQEADTQSSFYGNLNTLFNPKDLKQAYIVALGVNDMRGKNNLQELYGGQVGDARTDICLEDYHKNPQTFVGCYAKIIQRIQSMQPDTKFFLMTMPDDGIGDEEAFSKTIQEIADTLEHCYVLDMYKYAPKYDSAFRRNYFAGHMNAMGYLLTAHYVMTYIDWIIRHNPVAFKYVQFIGSPYRPYLRRRKTPIMGWASWNCFKTDISEERIRQQAKALVDTGLAECGYSYCNIDDGFFGGRDEDGKLLFHKERFPNGIKGLAEYIHSLGLKAGIYSDAGDNTCGHYYNQEGDNGYQVGLYGHEKQDLYLYLVENDFDFIKVDWCGGVRLGLDEEEQYYKIGKIIDQIRLDTNKEVVYNICRWQFPGAWAAKVADSWRTGADICPEFSSVLHQLDMIKPLARYCSPGHVNDLDMMQIGNGLTFQEEKSHFAMWCMMSTPLIIGCDLTAIKEETLQILKNKELIALNQDSACLQAYVIKEFRDEQGEILGEVWMKELGCKDSKERAIAFLNRSDSPLKMELTLEEAGLLGEALLVRDLWKQEDCTEQFAKRKVLSFTVVPHGTEVYRVRSEASCHIVNKDDKGEIVTKPFDKITVQEAYEYVSKSATLVDVRSAEEYKEQHLAEAINIPYMDIHAIAANYLKDKSSPVIVYCGTGKRSSQAKRTLEYLGYEKVYYLGGVSF